MDSLPSSTSPVPGASSASRAPCSPRGAMGACGSYPLCAASAGADGDGLRPGTRRASRPAAAPALRTFELEELGLLHERGAAPERVVVAYEDGRDGIPHRDRRLRPACAPDACAPLGNQSADALGPSPLGPSPLGPSPLGPSPPRRARPATGPPTCPEKAADAEDDKLSSGSATDNEDEEEDADARCCEAHKLCMCELRRHRSADDCWLVAYGRVFDVTGILHAHPGGARCLLRKAGGPDCSQDMDFHSRRARRMLDKCFIGRLEPCGEPEPAACRLM